MHSITKNAIITLLGRQLVCIDAGTGRREVFVGGILVTNPMCKSLLTPGVALVVRCGCSWQQPVPFCTSRSFGEHNARSMPSIIAGAGSAATFRTQGLWCQDLGFAGLGGQICPVAVPLGFFGPSDTTGVSDTGLQRSVGRGARSHSRSGIDTCVTVLFFTKPPTCCL